MNLSELSKRFNTKKRCIKHLEKVRWGKEPKCPHCDSEKYYKRKASINWHCNNCNMDTSVLFGTVFEDTRLSLPLWFQVIFIMVNSKMGVASTEISRLTGVTQKTAWYAAMRVRCAMLDWGYMLDGIIESDEVYIGGKPRHRRKRIANNTASLSTVYDVRDTAVKRGRGTQKIPVAGMVQRQGSVIAKVMTGLTSKDLLDLLRKAVKYGTSKLITDELPAYRRLGKVIKHYRLNHKQKEYARKDPRVDFTIHTNTIEGFWSIIKNGIKGNYRVISKKYLPFYIAEYCYKYNRRKLSTGASFAETMDNAVGDDKCFVDNKPKKDVRDIVYPRNKRAAEIPEPADEL